MFTKSVTVSIGVSKWKLFFIKSGVKTVISNNLNKCYMLLFMSLAAIFAVHQDDVLEHTAFKTVQLLQRKTPNFLLPKL